MRMCSMLMIPKPGPNLLHIPTAGGAHGLGMQRPIQLDKVVVVMGATGTGKSRLSIDLATRFPSEIINSDKMQVYKGLDIVTNKITDEESRGVPHHLLGVIDPNADFTASNFCNMAASATKSIVSRRKLPIIVGGSNSFIEALIDDDYKFRSRYQFCFLWVDASMSVLHSFVSERVDRMVERGMIDEARNMFDPNISDYSRGIRRSIGLPEFDRYFRISSSLKYFANSNDHQEEIARARVLEEAINETKINTCKLARRQREKIIRLRSVKGWKIHRLNATEVLRKRGEEAAEKAWENLVVGPSTRIVSQFLYNYYDHQGTSMIYHHPTRAANSVVGMAAAATPLEMRIMR